MADISDFSETLRELDPERYLASLYLPETIRGAVQTLYLFDAEISRIPRLVSEPMPGEIRLQWWRDVLKGERAGEAASHPLASTLLDIVEKFNLPKDRIATYLDAKVFDLYNDPMPDKGTYEGYLGETSSFWFLNACLCAELEQASGLGDAAGHAGVAFGMVREVAQLSRWNATGRCFVPTELLNENGLELSDWLYLKPEARHHDILRQLCNDASDHLEKAKEAILKLPSEANSIFLPLVFTRSLLNKIEKSGLEVFTRPVQTGPLRRQFLALRAGITGNL